MHFTDVVKKSVLEGFAYEDFTTTKIVITLLIAYAIAMYIHMVYKYVTKNSFYCKNYGISMTIMSVVTAGILMAMQSSLVISLGMVGALSIVRFRTAIKDPMDLLFLFWSIANGIICGAGLYEMAIIVSVVATIGIIIFQIFPIKRKSYLLVVNLNTRDITVVDKVVNTIAANSQSSDMRAKNVNRNGIELIYEIYLSKENSDIVDELLKIETVEDAHLLKNDAEIKS